MSNEKGNPFSEEFQLPDGVWVLVESINGNSYIGQVKGAESDDDVFEQAKMNNGFISLSPCFKVTQNPIYIETESKIVNGEKNRGTTLSQFCFIPHSAPENIERLIQFCEIEFFSEMTELNKRARWLFVIESIGNASRVKKKLIEEITEESKKNRGRQRTIFNG